MNIQTGQNKDIQKVFPTYNREKSHIVAEGGNDNNDTFKGEFLVKIYKNGVYKFSNGILIKKVS
jgi:hypothetical protein